MSISEQGWAAIQAYESSQRAADNAKKDAEFYAVKLMVQHLYKEHKFSINKLSKLFNLKRRTVIEILKQMPDASA